MLLVSPIETRYSQLDAFHLALARIACKQVIRFAAPHSVRYFATLRFHRVGGSPTAVGASLLAMVW